MKRIVGLLGVDPRKAPFKLGLRAVIVHYKYKIIKPQSLLILSKASLVLRIIGYHLKLVVYIFKSTLFHT